MPQQFETMIGQRKKQFTCGICHQSRTYGSWEDAEVFFQDDFIVHLGCLENHYRELIQKGTTVLEKLNSAEEIMLAPSLKGKLINLVTNVSEAQKLLREALHYAE